MVRLMTRGETNDYTIELSVPGEVFFSARRLVTNATRITVDFEYTDRQFTRNLVGVSAKLTAFGNRLQINTSMTQEADDPSSPIDVPLNDSLRSIIAASGTDHMKATTSGITYAGRDSITLAGTGQVHPERHTGQRPHTGSPRVRPRRSPGILLGHVLACRSDAC